MNVPDDKIVILFDGVCNFCNALVNWLIAHDARDRFRFASLQSDLGKSLLRCHGLNDVDPQSVVVIDAGRVYQRSDAAIHVAQEVGGIFAALTIFRFIPRPIRDFAYRCVAKVRYHIFGRSDTCRVPDEQTLAKFLA